MGAGTELYGYVETGPWSPFRNFNIYKLSLVLHNTNHSNQDAYFVNKLSKQEEEEQRLNSLMYGMTTKNPTPILSICGRGFASPTDLKIHLEQNPNSAQVLSVVDRNLPIHVICIKGIPLITSQNIRSYTILFILRTIKH